MAAKINENSCKGCGSCIGECPASAISLNDNFAFVEEDECFGCGICIDTCSHGAITIE